MQTVIDVQRSLRWLAMAVVFTACGTSASSAPEAVETVDIRLGQTLTLPDQQTTLRFTDVTSDSRCPTGAQCVWAGEAVTQFVTGGNERLTLTLGADTTRAIAAVLGTRITLTALKPAPSVTGSVSKADYVATLRFASLKD